MSNDARLRRELNNPGGGSSRKRKVDAAVGKPLDYASWILDRQEEERKASLIRRLDRLAEDAKIERLDAAAAVLFGAAEALRGALNLDRAASHAEKERHEAYAARHGCNHARTSAACTAQRLPAASTEGSVSAPPVTSRHWNGQYAEMQGLAELQQVKSGQSVLTPQEALLALEALLIEYRQ